MDEILRLWKLSLILSKQLQKPTFELDGHRYQPPLIWIGIVYYYNVVHNL